MNGPRLTVLIGPSAAGKSTVLAALARRRPVQVLRTVTTRPRRPGETDDTHEFVTPAEFERRERVGAYVGTHIHYGHRYALPCPAGDGPPAVTVLRAAVLDRLRAIHPDLFVVQLQAPVEVLLARLAVRGDAERADTDRLAAEMAQGRRLADLTIDTTEAVDVVVARLADEWAARVP